MKIPLETRSLIPSALAILVMCQPASGQANLTITNELKIEMTPGAPNVTKLLSDGCFYSIKPRPLGDAPILSLHTYTSLSTVFFWEAGRTALRAGLFSGARLQPWNMGAASTAFGLETEAYGLAIAGGAYSKAYGHGSVAFGQLATTATNAGWSLAVGDGAMAHSYASVALGAGVNATGVASVALNYATLGAGDFSLAAGFATQAQAYSSVAIGRYNVGVFTGPNGGTTWNDVDPLFEIGIGTPPGAATNWQPIPRNAMTVYKDGKIIIPKRQGDILMGEFGNPGN